MPRELQAGILAVRALRVLELMPSINSVTSCESTFGSHYNPDTYSQHSPRLAIQMHCSRIVEQ